jgi:hypothetical protein
VNSHFKFLAMRVRIKKPPISMECERLGYASADQCGFVSAEQVERDHNRREKSMDTKMNTHALATALILRTMPMPSRDDC